MKKDEDIHLRQLERQLNSLIDNGKSVSIEIISEQIKKENTFTYIKETFSDEFYIGDLEKKFLNELEKYFKDLSNCYTPEKFGVSNNGLCLLIAYCIERSSENKKFKL